MRLTEDGRYRLVGLPVQLGHSIRHVPLQVPVRPFRLDVEEVLKGQTRCREGLKAG